jgi:hypothetical protein
MGWDQDGYLDGSGLAFRHFRHGVLFDHGVLFHRMGPHACILLLVIAGVALLAMGSGSYGARRREADARRRARDRIIRAVDEALDEALKAADDDALIVRTHELVKAYDRRLGALVRLTAGVGAPLEALRKAANSRKAKEKDKDKDKEKPSAEAAAERVVVKLVETPVGNLEYAPPFAAQPAARPAPADDDITVGARAAAVRKALEAFAKAWRDGGVEALLGDAQRALLDDGE